MQFFIAQLLKHLSIKQTGIHFSISVNEAFSFLFPSHSYLVPLSLFKKCIVLLVFYYTFAIIQR